MATLAADNADRARAGSQQPAPAKPEMLVGGVELSRFLEAYPLPWSCECHRNEHRPRGINRSEISAADRTLVANGMNNAKAAFITHRVNCHDDLLEMTKLLERTVEYEIRVSKGAGDDEGARMKAITLNLVRGVIAKAEGRA